MVKLEGEELLFDVNELYFLHSVDPSLSSFDMVRRY